MSLNPHYRIKQDNFGLYVPQTKTWWWPWWVTIGGHDFISREYAQRAINQHYKHHYSKVQHDE